MSTRYVPLEEAGMDVYRLQLEFDGYLGDDELEQGVAAVAYAFAKLAGEEFGPVENVRRRYGQTVCQVTWDSTKSRRDDWLSKAPEVVKDAKEYVRDGTPPRKTNRAGPINSRAVEGIQTRVRILAEVPAIDTYQVVIKDALGIPIHTVVVESEYEPTAISVKRLS